MIVPSPPLILAALLFAQTSNPWDGTWKWATYAERVAWDRQWHAQIAADAEANCGKPYFGTYCQLADGTYGYASR